MYVKIFCVELEVGSEDTRLKIPFLSLSFKFFGTFLSYWTVTFHEFDQIPVMQPP